MRSYAAQDVISLPTLSAAGAVALGQGLITTAKTQTAVPTLIATRLRALETAHSALHRAVSEKPKVPLDSQRARAADVAEDHAWGAFHDWLLAWTKVEVPAADKARAMYAVLFPTRLRFTQLSYQLEWAEADTKLARITTAAFEPEIERLGGKIILEQLRIVHQAYGEALGITTSAAESAATGIREPLKEFTSVLRAYVLAVSAHADPKDESSIALTDALLAPLYKWQSHINMPATTVIDEPTSIAATALPQAGATEAVPASARNGGQS